VTTAYTTPVGWVRGVGFAQMINGTPRFFTNSSGRSAGWLSADLGDDQEGFFVQVGHNNNATNPNPGSVNFVTATGTGYGVWVSSAGDLRIYTARPSGAVSDTAGVVVGSQTSSRDAKNIEAMFTDYRGALDTILNTNLYSFTYKKTDFPEQKFVGLVTDESPSFGQYPDQAHPNGRALNVVNSIGYLMAAIKAQQAEIEALRRRIQELAK
jgi:hypothetical protein